MAGRESRRSGDGGHAGEFQQAEALVIQSDQFAAHATVTVLLVSSTLVDAPLIRVTVHPSERNGRRKPRT